MIERMAERMTERMTERITDRMTERMAERITERMTKIMTEIMTERMAEETLGELGSYLPVPLALEIVNCSLYLFISILCKIKFCSKNVFDEGVPEEKVELHGLSYDSYRGRG